MSFDFIPLVEDADIFETIYKHRGVVYGGYLRDVIFGDIPKDIDVVISEFYQDSFYSDPLIKTYTKTFNSEKQTYLLTKVGQRELEVYAVEDHPDDTLIGPVSEPDFDVNLLVSINGFLYNWTTGDPDVKDILTAIKEKRAYQFSSKVRPLRIEKIKARGYTILPTKDKEEKEVKEEKEEVKDKEEKEVKKEEEEEVKDKEEKEEEKEVKEKEEVILPEEPSPPIREFDNSYREIYEDELAEPVPNYDWRDIVDGKINLPRE